MDTNRNGRKAEIPAGRYPCKLIQSEVRESRNTRTSVKIKTPKKEQRVMAWARRLQECLLEQICIGQLPDV